MLQATPCVLHLRDSPSLSVLGICVVPSEFLPHFSSLQNFLEWCHLFFSFQLSTRCWWFPNLYLKFRSLFWVPWLYNQVATSHSCLTRYQTISTKWNLLFSKSMTEWLSYWQKHWGIILDYFLFLKSAFSNNQSPCPTHFISSMFLEILPFIPNTLVYIINISYLGNCDSFQIGVPVNSIPINQTRLYN